MSRSRSTMSPMASTARALRDSARLLQRTNDALDESIEDIPRLRKILDTQKLFGVVPEMDVRAAEESASRDMDPKLEQLGDRLEKKLDRLRRKKTGLENQARLLQIRLEKAENLSPRRGGRAITRHSTDARSHQTDLDRLRFLRNKSERLSYSLSQMKRKDSVSRLSFVPSLPPS